MGYAALRWLFFLLIVKPFLLLAVGVNVRRRDRLPAAGPALIVANHNSHLDALVLMALLPLWLLPRLRPVASADYFLSNRWRAWFATRVIGIIPVTAGGGCSHADVLGPVRDALAAGDIVIFFPEGTAANRNGWVSSRPASSGWFNKYRTCPFTRFACTGWARYCPRATGCRFRSSATPGWANRCAGAATGASS